MAQAPVRTTIRAEFEERFARSRAAHDRARKVIPGGITHDGRHQKPFPVYVDRAEGARKWDLDGNELLDFVVGHGSLILGHGDPAVTEAVRAQMGRGTHHGASHELEVEWAEQIAALVPSAERVKFTGSGTESTMLALRVARAYAGPERPTVVKLQGHFHGWHDYLLKAEKPPFEDEGVVGVPEATLGTVAVVPADDLGALEARLGRGDVAAVILEPSGASWGTVPFREGYLAEVRDLTARLGVVLIFDEVITGFRWAPGGAQARSGVTPDLTTFAKIVAGGLPGGAIVGKAEVMEHLAFRDAAGWNASRKVRHQGTYNANPVSAAAGLACLQRCADGSVQDRCDALAARLRAGLNATLARRGVRGFAWGESSVFHVALGEDAPNRGEGDLRRPVGLTPTALKLSGYNAFAGPLGLGMLLEGVDLFHGGGMLSAAHTEADVDFTVGAFDRVLGRMGEEGVFG